MEGCTTWDAFKYLGVPIFKSNPKASHWDQLIGKLKNRINSWGANWLNLAGKVVLIKAVLASILIYQSSLFLAPMSTFRKIEALFKRFLWEGGKQTGRKLHLISWEKITKPYLEGALQFKNPQTQNLALGAKILWRIITDNSSWSKRALWKKYFRGPRKKCLDNLAKVEKGSPIFSLCQKALRHFKPHLTWTPGNGKEIKVWEDSIMGDLPLDSKQGLDRLKECMRLQNLHSM
jgi:hypothetical protein